MLCQSSNWKGRPVIFSKGNAVSWQEIFLQQMVIVTCTLSIILIFLSSTCFGWCIYHGDGCHIIITQIDRCTVKQEKENHSYISGACSGFLHRRDLCLWESWRNGKVWSVKLWTARNYWTVIPMGGAISATTLYK